MNNLHYFLFFFTHFSLFLHAQDPSVAHDNGVLEIKVTGIETLKGTLRLAIYDTKNSYDRDVKNDLDQGRSACKRVEIPVHDHQQLLRVALDYGSYGIMLFHDSNENRKLDKNMLGIPKEPYGFSNNARAVLSAPPFENVQFQFTKNNVRIDIHLK